MARGSGDDIAAKGLGNLKKVPMIERRLAQGLILLGFLTVAKEF
jgi:hypothetical protein